MAQKTALKRDIYAYRTEAFVTHYWICVAYDRGVQFYCSDALSYVDDAI